MSNVKEILELMKLKDALKEAFIKEGEEINSDELGAIIHGKEPIEKIEEKITNRLTIALGKTFRLFFENIIKKDAELKKIYDEKGSKGLEIAVLKKYKAESEELIQVVKNEHYKIHKKEIEEVEKQINTYPNRSLVLATSLYYGTKGTKKTGTFVGNKIKDSAFYLWDNKEDIRDKLVDAAMKREEAIEKERKKLESEYAKLKVIYEKYSNKELLNIVRDENEKGINRRTAQRILKARK